MSVLSALAKVEAARTGRAQPKATVRHCHIAERPLVVIPLKLAGEAAAPLALLAGTSPDDARLLIVPQPRDRVLRLRFAEQFASVLLPMIARFTDDTEPVIVDKKTNETVDRCVDAPQIWVPNPAGVSFLRLLGRSLRFRRTEGDDAVAEAIPALGRWLTWFCDRAEHPGSTALSPLTTHLSTHWTTGQSALEDANLSALLGWIAPPNGLSGPEAAERAEDPTICPPAGPATDPGFDNVVLAPLISAYNTAPDEVARGRAVQRLEQALRTQVEPTWALMWQGIALLRALPEGSSVPNRWAEDVRSFSFYAETLAEGTPQPRRDSAVSAVRRLLGREQALEKLTAAMAYDDPYVMMENRLAGTACLADVVDTEPTRTTLSDKGKRILRPLLRVATTDPFTPVVGEVLHNTAIKGQKATVLELEDDIIVVELSGGMGRSTTTPAEGTVNVEGDRIVLARFGPDGNFRPAGLPATEETPWTHGGPPEFDEEP
ncbi:hypothetical protein [Nocardia camponoti]|uniref:Uncharacterized protein n=1 Tax=Nocardia camponoti TaxID=1616106 RepID=A0A917Q8A2_9NOCA|nr:hypothetical protein [Nocardia camponoti]GGK34435.1 hypothetical protein GCM10011591_02650 [Nocardia camponoti]